MRIKKYLKTAVISFMISFSLQAQAMMPVIDVGAIAQLVGQAKLLQQQLRQLEQNQYEWSNAQNLINELGRVVNKANSLAYDSANIDQQFKTSFPGYKPPQDFNAQYQQNIEQTLNTLNGVLQSMGMNANDFKNENTRLHFLQNQSQNAVGQLQAIQASSQIASETVSQLQLLRQTTIAQTNAQTAYYATQLQNEASGRAQLAQIIGAGSTQVPVYGSSGNYLTIDY